MINDDTPASTSPEDGLHARDEVNGPESFSAIVSRRRLLQSTGGLAAAAIVAPGFGAMSAQAAGHQRLNFQDLPLARIYDHAVAEGYEANILIRWGDAVLPNAPDFHPVQRSADAQGKQFGQSNDFIAYFPLPAGSNSSDHGLLSVNHEYTDYASFFPGISDAAAWSADDVAADMAAMGLSIIEVKKTDGNWSVVKGSPYARRITPTTPTRLSGPVAGHARARTSADPSGRAVLGTIGNCAGGKTPWGTVLTAEENFQNYFRGSPEAKDPEAKPLAAFDISGDTRKTVWGQFEKRFDTSREPRESNRFGYMVEIDPYDPNFVPVKRTHLGRFRHEAASVTLARDGRVVVYLGEDREAGYIFRFVSSGRYRPGMGKVEAGNLLDQGTLFVARFSHDRLDWLPMIPRQGALSAYQDLGSVMIEAPICASLMGATPMDRPEDIDFNPVNGRIYVNLTMNASRKGIAIDKANPRGPNLDGHILELTPPGGDHTAQSFRWTILLIAGPGNSNPMYGPGTKVSLSGPDNLAVDPQGRLWIATDNKRWNDPATPIPNGLFACAVEGPELARVKFFYNIPEGAELCGPEFTPDGKTLFVAIQNPDVNPDGSNKNWPDFVEGTPARSSIVVIQRKDRGVIGS